MLAFLEHLADRAEGVPLLIVGIARPELFERHPDYARGLRNNTPINLAPLSEQETARMVAALLETTVVPEALQGPVLERAGGNPLYAEEFVRLLKDRDLLVKKGSSWELTEGAEIPFPDSVQALIAARLDTLSPERKAMLADAAVVGKVFWVGAVAAMGSLDEAEVTEAMHELSRKELVSPTRRSTMEGESQYAFRHVLARDVAYAQLPRASRSSRHVAAASWIESKAPDRLEDLAEVLAYHYATALELAGAAGHVEQVRELEAPALRSLKLAGERALGLNTAAALDAFERALALTPPGHPERPQALVSFGEAAEQFGRATDAAGALEEAIGTFRDRGDILAVARAMSTLGLVLQALDDTRAMGELDAEVLALLEPLPPGPELTEALADAAFDAAVGGKPEEGVALAERALTVAAEAGLPRPARALGVRAFTRCQLGDPEGLEDFREALELAAETGKGRDMAILHNNFGISLRNLEGPRQALEVFDEGRSFAEARGMQEMVLLLRTSTLSAALGAGELERALAEAVSLGTEPRIEFDRIEIRAVQAIALTLRGQAVDSAGFLGQIVEAAPQSGRTDMIAVGLGAAAVARAALGETEIAATLLHQLEATPGLTEIIELAPYLPAIVRAALSIGEPDLAGRLAGRLAPRYPYAEHALVAANAALAEARGHTQVAADAYADAAARWEHFGVVPEQGLALLGEGRCLLDLSRQAESVAVLQRARGILDHCGMSPGLEEIDTLLAEAAGR